MKNDRVELRIDSLGRAPKGWQTAMVEIADTMDNAALIAGKYLPNATAADIIKIAEMMLERSDRTNRPVIDKMFGE